jgi:dipeptidyl aminopeptidase/acylaminoacyl peptidase
MRALASHCALLLLLGTAAAAPAADLADVETFLGQVSFDEVRLSPDGSRLAFITHRDDSGRDREVYTLWSIGLDAGGRASAPVQLVEMESCTALRWSPDGRSLSFLATAPADPAPQLAVVAPSPGAAIRRLTDAVGFPDGIDLYEWLPDGSGFVVAAVAPAGGAAAGERRQPSFLGDVRRLPNPAPHSSLSLISLADAGVVRLGAAPFDEITALAVSPDGRWLASIGNSLRETIEGNEVALLPLTPGAATGPRRSHNFILEEHLAWAGKDLFVSGMGEERDGRYTATEPRLYRADTGDLLLTPVALEQVGGLAEAVPLAGGSLLTVTNRSTHMLIALVEPASGAVRTLRDQRGWISNLTATPDGRRIAFVAGDAHHFAEIHLAQGPEGVAAAGAVTAFNAGLSAAPLPEIETVSWEAGDGVTVEGVLFWPPGRRGERGLPLIVDLHGGPFGVARTEALDLFGAHMSYPALLAARGFLVLNPNYRGSAGRGDDFARGIEGHRCSRPADDVIRGVESLAARGWADRGRVGVIGYSGGGGLSKCLIGRTDLFGAAATGAGVWDDMALFGTGRGGFWAEVFFESRSPWEDFQRWWSESPISALARVRTPTLIVAGELDGTGPAQATEMYHNLVWHGSEAELLLFPGERHIFTRPSHKRAKIRAEISWLEHHLLGRPRAEPASPTR